MGRKSSIYLGESVLSALLDTPGKTTSGRISSISRRYAEAVAAGLAAVTFTREEWLVLVNTLDARERAGPDAARDIVEKVSALPRIPQDTGVDPMDLGERLRAAGPLAWIAVIEISDRYWCHCDTLDHDLALRASGVDISSEKGNFIGAPD